MADELRHAMNATRRDFLKTAGAAVSISILAPRFAVGAASSDRALVVLQLAGGNDALNTFIPYADAAYRSARPTLAIADAAILKVHDRIGLHPSMARLAALYEQRRFTFVNGVGFPTLDRSHFHCQDVWQTGFEESGSAHGGHGSTGWLGRFADVYLGEGASSLTALSIGSRIPLGMASEDVIAAAVASAEGYTVLTDARYPEERAALVGAIRHIYEVGGGMGETGMIRMSGAEMFDSIDLMATIPPPSAIVTYPATPLGRALRLVAQVLAGGVGTRLVWVTLGGFDTHSLQTDTHARLLTDVSDSLAAFQDDLDARGESDRVLVLAWSEFGRRVRENASAGTDHGKGGTVLLLGNGVRGGTPYGEIPLAESLDDGDLVSTIDFRSVYWTIIRDWFDRDPEPVLHGRYENIGFVAREAVGRRRSVRR
jgi:uncharacterized protein (DUF1501 family)